MKMLILLLIISCGGDTGYNSGSRSDGTGTQSEQDVKNFSTRINDNLLIAGRKCEGNETVSDMNGASVSCMRDQWLITLDNVNRCSGGASCTEIGVLPFVANLVRSNVVSIPESTFFVIQPVSAITPVQTAVINDYFVRFDMNGGTMTVVAR